MAPASGVEYRVCPLRDLPEGGGVLALVGDVEVGVFLVRGRVHAYENRCRHQGGPVCTGEIIGRHEQVLNPDGTVAAERMSDDQVRIACPWHGWEYDLETGRCTADPGYRLHRFPVEVRDGDVYVRV